MEAIKVDHNDLVNEIDTIILYLKELDLKLYIKTFTISL